MDCPPDASAYVYLMSDDVGPANAGGSRKGGRDLLLQSAILQL